MIEMLKRHEVQVLRRAGHTWKEIAALSGVSVRTVRRIAAETEITTIDNAAERARRQVGRPSKADAYRDVLVQALTEEPTLRSVELLIARGRRATPVGRARSMRSRRRCGARGDAAGAIRRPPRRVLAARFRRSARALSGRDGGDRALLRLAIEMLALGGGDAGGRRAGRKPGACARRSRRRLRRHSAGGGLRSAEDRRAEVGPRWRRHRVEFDVCRRGARSRAGRGGVLAVSAAGERQRRESGRLGEGLVLQAATVSRSRGSGAAAARLAHRGEYGPPIARHRGAAGGGSPRSARGCGR